MTHWRVASTWQGGTHSRAQVEGFAIGGAKVPRRFSIDIESPSNSAAATPSPIRRNTCSQRSTPA